MAKRHRICHTEAFAEVSQGLCVNIKFMRFFACALNDGKNPYCHAELVSASYRHNVLVINQEV